MARLVSAIEPYPTSRSKTTIVTMPARDEHDLAQRVAVDLAAVQIGDQIRHRDVEQAGRRKREDVRPDGRHHLTAPNATRAPTMPEPPETMFSISARRRL